MVTTDEIDAAVLAWSMNVRESLHHALEAAAKVRERERRDPTVKLPAVTEEFLERVMRQWSNGDIATTAEAAEMIGIPLAVKDDRKKDR